MKSPRKEGSSSIYTHTKREKENIAFAQKDELKFYVQDAFFSYVL